MTLEDLKMKLCDFGNPQIVKEGVVFSVLLTGKGLSKSRTVMKLQDLILDYAKEKFPLLEAMRNDDEFFCLILKPKQ